MPLNAAPFTQSGHLNILSQVWAQRLCLVCQQSAAVLTERNIQRLFPPSSLKQLGNKHIDRRATQQLNNAETEEISRLLQQSKVSVGL